MRVGGGAEVTVGVRVGVRPGGRWRARGVRFTISSEAIEVITPIRGPTDCEICKRVGSG